MSAVIVYSRPKEKAGEHLKRAVVDKSVREWQATKRGMKVAR